jgi:hypothetical protein
METDQHVLSHDDLELLRLLARGLPLNTVARRLRTSEMNGPPPGQGNMRPAWHGRANRSGGVGGEARTAVTHIMAP